MLWQQLLENCVKRAIQTNRATRQKYVRVVLSPDIDGIVSACLLSHYLAEKHNAATEIIGTYNGRHVRMIDTFRLDDLRDAIWLDLDVRFSEVKTCIGQHFLGPLTMRTSAASFNPNCIFQIENMSDKYPFATAHLILFGLLSEKIFPPGLFTPMGKAAVAHADSCFWVCRKYKSNAQKWTDRLFDDRPTPDLFQEMLSDSYINNNYDGHFAFVQKISPFVYNGKTQVENLPCHWRSCTGNQTAKATNETVLFRNVNALTKIISTIFQSTPPVTFNPVRSKTVWEGTKLRMEPSVHTEDLETYMQKYNIRSHAITSARTISMTQGPTLIPIGYSDISFY